MVDYMIVKFYNNFLGFNINDVDTKKYGSQGQQRTAALSLNLAEIKLVENGLATDFSEEKALEILKPDEITAVCDIKSGDAEAVAWGCDLTYDYVKINADYRS